MVGRAFTLVSWPVALVLLASALCWLWAGSAWSLDLIANLGAQWLLVSLVLALVWLASRRWTLATVAVIACVLHVASLTIGRAALWPRPISAGAPTTVGGGTVRFFHYNASTRGEDGGNGDDIEAAMAAAHADVLSLLCPPVAHQRSIIYGRGLEDRYPGKLVREFREDPVSGGADVTAGALLSRWPMHRADTAWAGPTADYLIAAIIERPPPPSDGGPFAVIAVHPRSPRNPERWALGNAVVQTVALVADCLQRDGYAVVVLADLNATPTGWRSHALYWDAGLRRAKPLFEPAGTYPIPLGPRDNAQRGPARQWPWPFSVALDDCLVSPTITVRGWGFMPTLESEHRPIIADLAIPNHAEIPPPPPSR